MTGERTRAINALTALLRTIDLGIDARRPLSATTITTIAAWRTSHAATVTMATAGRGEAIRLARRIRALDKDLAANHTALTSAVTTQAPELLHLRGVGRSSPRSCCRPGPTLAASTPKPRSPPSPASHRYRHPRATPGATGSTAVATAASTGRSTPSR